MGQLHSKPKRPGLRQTGGANSIRLRQLGYVLTCLVPTGTDADPLVPFPTGSGGQVPVLPIVPTAGDTFPARAVTLPKIMGTDSSGAGASTGSPTVPNATSLPPKLMRRILANEFIDMQELLPESWRSEPQQTGGASRTVARGPVRDFKLWTECYGTLARVLTTAYPEKAPHLMAYLRMMAWASRNYETDAWVEYDIAHRR